MTDFCTYILYLVATKANVTPQWVALMLPPSEIILLHEPTALGVLCVTRFLLYLASNTVMDVARARSAAKAGPMIIRQFRSLSRTDQTSCSFGQPCVATFES